ncbi:unnamed protein product [[Candida] boidinii]|nr:unnamed protein product [[Candida] boidinii]
METTDIKEGDQSLAENLNNNLKIDEIQDNSITEQNQQHIADLNSHTEDEGDDDDEEDDEEDKQLQQENQLKQEKFEEINNTYGMTIIPDSNVDMLEADIDLTNDIPLDTDTIDLVHLKVKSLKDLKLERFKNLKYIFLRDNLIESISDLKLIENKELIEEIDLYDNRINHISKHVDEFKNIKTLDLSFNKIKNIKNIENLTELENLYFVQNKISEIKNIENLQKLINLELGGNKIEIISEVMLKMKNLEQLWLGKNKILEFQNLNNLSNLKILSIQSNKIKNLENLEGLVNLEELYVSHNKIEKLSGLDNLKNLTVLDVTGNFIEKLENLKHLKNLTDFWCSYNRIGEFNTIEEELKDLPELDTVYFEGNPIQLKSPTNYRRKLRLCLGPSLKKIDALYLN